MPEFQLDHGSPAGHDSFMALDEFTQGYIEAMFFTECHADNPELEEATFEDLAPSALAEIRGDCLDFQESFGDLLDKAEDEHGYYAKSAGADFWYTRNGHGVGFWDRGLGSIGRELTDMSEPYGLCDMYRGDDGLIYVS